MRVIFFILLTLGAYANPVALQFHEVAVLHQHAHEEELHIIQRKTGEECTNVHINPETIYGGSIAAKSVPQTCKKTAVISVGKIQPMSLGDGIQTVGEIEVLDFIENKLMQEPQKYVLVDSRRPNWYEVSTIPGAVNIPYDEMTYDEDFHQDFDRMLQHLNVKQTKDGFDFSQAKTALLFCNGSWCGQSGHGIKILLKMGYPKEKILWYRGGLQDWVLTGFNVIKPKL